MSKIRSFSEYHKQRGYATNDIEQPRKFFNDMAFFLQIIDDAPWKAIEDLEKFEMNRDIMVNVVRRIMKILTAAGIDIIKEIERMNEDPFDGLEEDLARKKDLLNKSNEEDN